MSRPLRWALSIVVAAFGALSPVTVGAQSARDYLNTPVGAATGYVDVIATSSETGAASELPVPNNEVVTGTGAATLLWSYPLMNKYGGVALGLPYAGVEVRGASGTTKTSAFGDPSVTLHANIFGAPALRVDQFPSAVPQTFSSFHLTIHAPLGEYDSASPVNVGANRWAFTPIVNLSITPDKGVQWIDLGIAGRFYTANNEFQGSNQLTQHPLLTLTAHYSHNIGKYLYGAIGLAYNHGGESFVNDVPQDDGANAVTPVVAISGAIKLFRLTLRYESTPGTPDGSPTKALLAFRVTKSLLF
ncbi:MAG TPA: transporter [Gemmatimonadales bacterium]|nr:transporter [Gemmatimonadales bacterium]